MITLIKLHDHNFNSIKVVYDPISLIDRTLYPCFIFRDL